MVIAIFIVVLSYVILIGSLIYGFDRIQTMILRDIEAKTKFSIVIPFRNEAENLPTLLTSLAQLNYPEHLFEVILVNDESTDTSVARLKELLSGKPLRGIKNQVSIINNERYTNSAKKDAISIAIKQAKFEWIVTTDADCRFPKYWLDIFDNYIQDNNPNMLVAPVKLDKVSSFFERFQALDFLSLQGAAIGGFGIKKPFLCNGANLAYKASIFESVHGFEGNAHLASGDDIFLLEKFTKHDPSKVSYLLHEQATVKTLPQPSLKCLKSQRVRWASKTSSYNNVFGKLTGIIVLVMNALIVCLPLLYITQTITLQNLIYTFTIKFLVDFLLLYKSARFFGQEAILTSYIFGSLIYPFFNVYVALVSMFKGYKWKGRHYNR